MAEQRHVTGPDCPWSVLRGWAQLQVSWTEQVLQGAETSWVRGRASRLGWKPGLEAGGLRERQPVCVHV